MSKIIDTSGPEWSSDLPTDTGVTYWMYAPETEGMYLVMCLGFVIPDEPDLGRKYDIAFSFSMYEEEMPKGARFARVADPPGCSR